MENKPKLLKTRIFVRAYCGNFDVIVKRSHFLTIKEAEECVRKEIIHTAMVIGVTHYTADGEAHIKNKDYKDPSKVAITKVSGR